RYLRARRHLVRAADGSGTIPRNNALGNAGAGSVDVAAGAPTPEAVDSARPGDNLSQMPGESARPALPQRDGTCERSGALSQARAHSRPGDPAPRALHQMGPTSAGVRASARRDPGG